MNSTDTLSDSALSLIGLRSNRVPHFPALVILWSRDEPGRVGEVTLIHGERVLGRAGEPSPSRLSFRRQRPDGEEVTGELQAARISRDQLSLRASGESLEVKNTGRLALKVNGEARTEARLEVGDVLELDRQLMLLVTRRPESLPSLMVEHPFGKPDLDGIVGESPIAWWLRRQIHFCAASAGHVLVAGPSGVGKELVAQAIHRMTRPDREMISRNAATLPEGILDAELFGNLKDYPNAGMIARSGILGEADGSTLFLDEIGEISHAMQAHLLRVLDRGEYQRLGDPKPRRVDFRLIAATNRSIGELKYDFVARLTRRIELPGLDSRREDIPLLAQYLLDGILRENPKLFPNCSVRLHPRLVLSLVVRPYTSHLREMKRLLWLALEHWSPMGSAYLDIGGDPSEWTSPTPRGEPTREEILAAYTQTGGVHSRVPDVLGLRDRFVLSRLERKLGITREEREAAGRKKESG